MALALTGCGSAARAPSSSTTGASVPRAHPQAIEPLAGAQAAVSTGSDPALTGDTNAHAPPLAQVKRELVELNLCGGATSAAQAQPVATASGPGIVADPGTIQDVGQLPVLTARLDALAKALHVVVFQATYAPDPTCK